MTMNEQLARERLMQAVIAIWKHTEKHTIFVDGVGYTSRSDVPELRCTDPAEHSRLAAEEGSAWHVYREFVVG